MFHMQFDLHYSNAIICRKLCIKCSLETWYFMALVLFAGYMKNAEAAVDALSIW